ncbi:MAG: hypothetical protein ACI4Q5_03420 [Porcipelethomonas sp.]
MADFIKYTDEIFPGIKNFKGECVAGKELYYLSGGHALYDYVKKVEDKLEVDFSDDNYNMLIYKIMYFLYPEKRFESFKNDISVEDFSSYCVSMFYRRFGIEFDFLRIKPDTAPAEFVEEQKTCLINLYESCLGLLMNKKEVNTDIFRMILNMFYQEYRLKLTNINLQYLISEYDPCLKSELKECVFAYSNSFHRLKQLYPKEGYLAGRNEIVNQLSKIPDIQIEQVDNTLNLISDVISAQNKQDVEKTVKSMSVNNLEPKEFLDFYSELEDDISDWKISLIDFWLTYSLIGLDEKADVSIITYAMYNDSYTEISDRYLKLCKKISEIRENNKKNYWKVLTEKICTFETMIYNTTFALLFQIVSRGEENE